jgi:putative transposase
MPDAARYGRRSIRMQGFDYSQSALYVVTICAQGHERILDRVFNGNVVLEPGGLALRDVWLNRNSRFACAVFLDYVVMPNHFHGTIASVDALPRRGAASSAPTACTLTLSKIIRAFQSLSATAVNRALGRRPGPVWQRNFWEHSMADKGELRTVREYVPQNPLRWDSNPENV